MKEEIQEGVYQINAYELDAHETLKEGDLLIVQSAGETSVLHKVTLAEIKTYIGGSEVPDSTITDVAPEYAASASYMFNVLNNREYRRLHLTDTIHAVAITFTTTTEINSRNEHYILVTNSAKSTTTVGSIAVNQGSFSELIGMSEAVEIPVGKSVEFSFKVYSDGTSRALIVTHSDVL